MDNDELLIVIKDIFDKKTDELKSMFEKKTDEIKLYVDKKINEQGTMIESLKSDIKAVAEGHEILNNKLDEVNNKVDVLNKRADGIEKDLDIVKNYVIDVDAKLNEHEIILERVK